MVSLALADDRQIQIQKQKHDQAQHSHTKSNNHYIKITECPTDPCAIYYTDAISQSILVVCQNPKHTDTAKDIEKQLGVSVRATDAQQPQASLDVHASNLTADIHIDVQYLGTPRFRLY